MRISKPSTTGEASYEIYQNIALRDQASEKLEDGQEVKVLDASGDPNIKNGWAIYKFSKESNLFDLLEKQEQPIIPAPTIINTDEFTIFKTTNDKLSVPEAMIGTRVEMRILEDFDFSLSYDGKDMQLVPFGGVRTIPIMYGGIKRFLTINNSKLSFAFFDNRGKGKRVNWVVNANVSDTNVPVTTNVLGFIDSGETVPVKPNSSDIQLQIMQVSVLVPVDGSAPKPEHFVIHKYWKKALAPAEERIVIPESSAPVVCDNETISPLLNTGEKVNAPDLQHPFFDDIRIMKDFDLQVVADPVTKNVIITINGSSDMVSIPIKTPSGTKYLKMRGHTISSAWLHANSMAGKTAYVNVSGYIKDTDEETILDLQQTMDVKGGVFLNTTRDVITDKVFPLVQVAIKVPLHSYWGFNGTMVKAFKYYKQILAPAEERIQTTAPEAVKIDNYTIEKNGNTLTVPAGLNPIRHNYTIRKNFQLDLNFDNKEFIRVRPRGADENGFLQIPIEKNGIVFALQLGTVDLPVSAFAGSPEMIHFGIMAKVESTQAPKVACEYIVEADGSPIRFVPSPTDLQICIAQIRAKKPVNTDGWKEEFVTMWRYWETALLETFSETPVDGYGAEYIENNGIKQITSIGAMTPNYYNLRYLQDFDFDFKVRYDAVNNTLNTVAIPIGGARTIKTTRAISDIDGIVLAKETLYSSVNTVDNTMNNPEKGKFYYFHFGSNLPSVDTLQGMNVTVSLTPNIRPQSNYMVTYGVFKIYIPKEGEAFDHGKIYVYRYWRNALASFDELMQDYQQRNP